MSDLPVIVITPTGVRIGEDDIRLGPRHRAIVAALYRAACSGEGLPFERLYSVVWPDPDDEPESSRGTLSKILCELRCQLLVAGLTVSRGTHPEPGIVRLRRMERVDQETARSQVARILGLSEATVERIATNAGGSRVLLDRILTASRRHDRARADGL